MKFINIIQETNSQYASERDEINITILVDNITDRLLPSLSLVKRPPMISNNRFNKTL